MAEVTELIKEYERQVPVKDLAKQFGIHRLTVTALLRRHGVEQRRVGLRPTETPEAASLYVKAGRWRGWAKRSVSMPQQCGGRCELPVWLCGLVAKAGKGAIDC
jgi:hypothetical protein